MFNLPGRAGAGGVTGVPPGVVGGALKKKKFVKIFTSHGCSYTKACYG
jgi:hypothetical protein